MIGSRSGSRSDGQERRQRLAAQPAAPSFDESRLLPLVMGEIADLMKAAGSILTLHPGADRAPALLHADRCLPEQVSAQMFDGLVRAVRPEFEDGRAFWRNDVAGRHSAMLVMPIEQMSGHGRLVISMLFRDITEAQRQEADRIYRERRPFAIGFFQLWQRNRLLQQRAQSLELVLDQTAIGLLMLDTAGHVVFTNQTADDILAAGDGLVRSNGALRAINLGDAVSLQAAIAHTVSRDGDPLAPATARKAPLLAFNRRNGPPLVAALLPTPHDADEPNGVAAVMYVVDPRIDTAKMLAPLCALYGLSRVETALVCHLAAGETLASAAGHMHVKEQTARSYLKTIFVKTGTKRQTELIVLMLSSLIRTNRDVLQEALTFGRTERAGGGRA